MLVRVTEHSALQAHPQLNALLISQTQTIHDRIERELKRARLSGHIQSGAAFNPYQELTALADLLDNIYTEKHLAINVEAPDYPIPFDREDLLEIIGNLANNACKWAKARWLLALPISKTLSSKWRMMAQAVPNTNYNNLPSEGCVWTNRFKATAWG